MFLRSLESDLAVGIVAAAATGAVSVVSLTISKAYETQTAIRQELRAKKTPIYEGIVETLFRALYAGKLGKQPLSEQDLMKFFAETTERLTIWGSDELVRAFGSFKQVCAARPESKDVIFSFERLLFAIRRDLGHKNRGLGRGSILRLFVNDIDSFL